MGSQVGDYAMGFARDTDGGTDAQATNHRATQHRTETRQAQPEPGSTPERETRSMDNAAAEANNARHKQAMADHAARQKADDRADRRADAREAEAARVAARHERNEEQMDPVGQAVAEVTGPAIAAAAQENRFEAPGLGQEHVDRVNALLDEYNAVQAETAARAEQEAHTAARQAKFLRDESQAHPETTLLTDDDVRAAEPNYEDALALLVAQGAIVPHAVLQNDVVDIMAANQRILDDEDLAHEASLDQYQGPYAIVPSVLREVEEVNDGRLALLAAIDQERAATQWPTLDFSLYAPDPNTGMLPNPVDVEADYDAAYMAAAMDEEARVAELIANSQLVKDYPALLAYGPGTTTILDDYHFGPEQANYWDRHFTLASTNYIGGEAGKVISASIPNPVLKYGVNLVSGTAVTSGIYDPVQTASDRFLGSEYGHLTHPVWTEEGLLVVTDPAEVGGRLGASMVAKHATAPASKVLIESALEIIPAVASFTPIGRGATVVKGMATTALSTFGSSVVYDGVAGNLEHSWVAPMLGIEPGIEPLSPVDQMTAGAGPAYTAVIAKRAADQATESGWSPDLPHEVQQPTVPGRDNLPQVPEADDRPESKSAPSLHQQDGLDQVPEVPGSTADPKSDLLLASAIFGSGSDAFVFNGPAERDNSDRSGGQEARSTDVQTTVVSADDDSGDNWVPQGTIAWLMMQGCEVLDWSMEKIPSTHQTFVAYLKEQSDDGTGHDPRWCDEATGRFLKDPLQDMHNQFTGAVLATTLSTVALSEVAVGLQDDIIITEVRSEDGRTDDVVDSAPNDTPFSQLEDWFDDGVAGRLFDALFA